jgi:hypothetical protein
VVSEQSGGNTFAEINQLLLKEFSELDLRRMDHAGTRLQMTYYINVRSQETLMRVMDNLRSAYPLSSITLVEQSNLLGG